MITGFMGIAYSTDEIKNGKFVDKTLENDYLQTRYDILRNPQRNIMNESLWRANDSKSREYFLKMMEASNQRNTIRFDESEEEESNSTIFTYDGNGEVPKNITTVIIANDVEEIEEHAFKDCTNLKSIVFNENLKRINKGAFENCIALTTVRLDGINFIGDEAFANCVGLLSVELGADIQHIGMGAFKNCKNLTQANLPPNVTFIGDYAFADCSSLVNVMVTYGVTELPSYCFQNDVALEQLILPSSIEKVGTDVFDNCPKCEVYVPTTNMKEAEEFLGCKMVARAEDDDMLFKCDKGYMVRLYKDLY